MKTKSYLYVLLGITILLFSSAAFAQVTTTGKIVGKVVDKTTGEPLIGATVIVIDQVRFGAATNIQGEFYIINLPVGNYSLAASFIGYRQVTVKNVHVSAGYTTETKFEMPTEAVQIGEVVIEATRPLIQKDQTNSTSITTAEEIKNLPLRGFEGVVTVQTGVVAGRGTESNTFYTRGGRSNETVIFVDGYEQNNLLTGEATVSVNTNAIAEVQTQTGGFDAEYGRALSGVINVITKESTPKYAVNLETESDFFMGEKYSRGYNIYNLSLSGPLIPNYDALTVFFSGELKNLATARGTQGSVGRIFNNGKMQDWNKGYLPHDRNDGLTLQGKLTYRFTPTAKLNLNFIHSNFTKQTYSDIWKYALDHSPWDNDKNTTISGALTYTFDKSTYMEVGGAYFMTKHFSGDGIFKDNISLYKTAGDDNPRNMYDAARGGYFLPSGWEKYQGNNTDTTGFATYLYGNPDSIYMIPADRYDPYGLYFAPGYARRYYQTYDASYINPKISLVSQLNENNQIKVGFEYRYHTLNYFETFEANRDTNGNLINAYGYTIAGEKNDNGSGKILDKARHPYDIAVYAQDKIEQEGLVVNVGVRYDLFHADQNSLKNPHDPLGGTIQSIIDQNPSDPRLRRADEGDFEETSNRVQISPRLGVGFPITDRTVFHFNYGKFFQQPNLTDLYYGTKLIEFKALNGSPAISLQNPNLKPEETISYEVGVTHQVADNMRLSISAYYKDTKNLVNVQYIKNDAPGGAALYLLSNQDYGTIKGIDISYEARRIGIFSGRLAYSLAFAEGTGSASRENFNAAWLGFQTAKFTTPLAFDQRHTISGNIDIRSQKGETSSMLADAGINILVLARSGFPYTPTKTYPAVASNISVAVPKDNPIDGVNTRYGPWIFRIDLKLDKEIDWGLFRTDIYLRVLNLLDTKNYLGVYQATGDANSDGYLGTSLGTDNAKQFDTDKYIYTTGADFIQKYNDRLNGVDVSVNGASQRKYDSPREVRLGLILNF